MTVLLGFGVLVVGVAVVVLAVIVALRIWKLLLVASSVIMVVGLSGLAGAAVEGGSPSPWKGLAIAGLSGLALSLVTGVAADAGEDD